MISWLKRAFGLERRAVISVPWDRGGPSLSTLSATRALSLIPYFACVRLLSEQIAALPLHVYRENGDAPTRIASRLLDQPAAVGPRNRWLKQAVVSLAMRGNAYGLVVARDGFGFATQVEWLHPDEVHVDESRPTLPIYYWRGTPVPYGDMFHIAWFVEPGRVKGLSPIAVFASSIGVGLEAVDYGSSWFEHGGTPPATFQNTQRTLTTDQADAISNRLDAAMRRRRPLTFGADWKFEALQVSPEESQFIETMKLNATQMANIFGIPPELVGGESGGSLTYDNPALDGLSLHKLTLRPWLEMLEEHFDQLLPERQYAEFNPDALLRSDTRSRYEAHRVALDAGFMTVNEVRRLEGLAPVDGGNTVSPRTTRAPVLDPEGRWGLPPIPVSPPHALRQQ